MRYISKLYVFFILSVFISISYLYFTVSKTQNSLQAKNFSLNIEQTIKQKISHSLYEELKENIQLREELQNSLTMLITPLLCSKLTHLKPLE
jgi:hypothetical protein